MCISNYCIVVDCTWSDWELGECSVTCEGGTQVDTRTVATPEMHGNCTTINGAYTNIVRQFTEIDRSGWQVNG